MSRYLLAALAVALAASGLSAAPVPPDASKGINFPYPAKAPVVVCLNGYDRARDPRHWRSERCGRRWVDDVGRGAAVEQRPGRLGGIGVSGERSRAS